MALEYADVLIVPLRVHMMNSKVAKNMETSLDSNAVTAIIEKANEVWKQARIRFDLEAITPLATLESKPDDQMQSETGRIKAMIPQNKLSKSCLDLCIVKDMTPNGFFYGEPIVVKDTAHLKDVHGGREEHLRRVIAHELGHALGLQHHEVRTNLMYPGVKGLALTPAQVSVAREHAQRWAH